MILCCCSLSSYQNCLWVDILFCFWNISCENLNIFPTAPINFLAIIWLKTLQGEKKNLIQWFTFTKSRTQECSLVFFLFNEILVGSSLYCGLTYFSFIVSFIIFFFCDFVLVSLVARTEYMWKPQSPGLKNFALTWKVLLHFHKLSFFYFIFFCLIKYGNVPILCVDGIISVLV